MLRAITSGLRKTNCLCAIAVVILLAIGLWGITLPQQQKLENLQQQLSNTQQKAVEIQTKREQIREELRWLNGDPNYLELIARDRIDLQKSGETIIRIDRTPPRRAIIVE